MIEIWQPNKELWQPKTLDEYRDLMDWLEYVREDEGELVWIKAMREYGLMDLFFLLNFVSSHGKIPHSDTGKPLFFHEFYLEMCQQNQWYIDNHISSTDHSARRGSKTLIRTILASLQMALRNPNISILFASLKRERARANLSLVKEEIETWPTWKVFYPDRLWDDPIRAAANGEAVWSLDAGLRFRRDRPRSTQTFEQQAFYGHTPTGAGYDVIHFDDCEDGSSVSTPENIEKLHASYAATAKLATPSEYRIPMIYITNTFYHPKGIAKTKYDEFLAGSDGLKYSRVRIAPGEDLSVPGDGPLGGTPRYPFTKEILEYNRAQCVDDDDYAIQYCCDFVAGQQRSLKREWITFVNEPIQKLAKDKLAYICIDASRGIYDPMAIWVWGTGQDKRLTWIGGSRKKLDPASQAFHDEIFNIVMMYKNLCQRVVEIRVEQMNSQTWQALILRDLQSRGVYDVPVIACRGKVRRTGKFDTAKLEREWSRWAPMLQRGDIVFPTPRSQEGFGIPANDENGTPYPCLVDHFLDNEYDRFPRTTHDDLLDSGALISEEEVNDDRPIQYPAGIYKRKNNRQQGRTWMSGG